MTGEEIIEATILVGSLGLICSLVLILASRFFAVKEDPRIEEATLLLPGANCGACGFGGCADYARAIVIKGEKVTLCKPGGPETTEKLAEFMGVKAEIEERKVAIVLCCGGDLNAKRRFLYNGIADCADAVLIGGGDKACSYGCLGLGTCARVCPEHAIEITEDRLAVVHPELCIGCGLCVSACPRKLIQLVPESRTIHVLCSSRDRGPVVKQNCAVGCIGCTLCTKITDAIKMDGTLACVDYSQPLDDEAVIAKCPQHTIVKRSGRVIV